MLRSVLILLILPLIFGGMPGCAQRRSTLLPDHFGKQPPVRQAHPVHRSFYPNPQPVHQRPKGGFSPIQQVSANLPMGETGETFIVPPERSISADQQITGNISPILSESQPFIPQAVAFAPPVNTNWQNLQNPQNQQIQQKQRPQSQSALLQALANEYKPLTDRNWIPNHTRQATAVRHGDFITIRNIRHTTYRTATDYTTTYYDATFPLAELTSVDLIEVPFKGLPSVAHVEVSFGFSDGRHLGVSVEARYEVGESYDPLGGMCNQFELIYVIADERDTIRINTDINKNDVYLYRLNLTQPEVQAMFLDIMNRANTLSTQPEFYHSIRNNCATNIIKHINHVKPNAIPREYRALFPGYLDHLLYDVKMIATESPTFKEAKNLAKINTLAKEYGDTEYFSAGIRQNLLY